ncbi:MAG: hypothetical protein AB7H43_15025, partial [Acidimicrobiia bacterium]
MAATDDPDAGADADLDDLPPEAFVAARDALAKRLRAGGDAAGAAEIRARRRPTVTQWLAGQVRRRRAIDVARFRSASLAVGAAQEAAVTGGDRDGLRAASDQRRDARRALARAVDETIAGLGRPAHHRDEVIRAVEEAVLAELATGTLGFRDDLVLPDRPARPAADPPPAGEEPAAADGGGPGQRGAAGEAGEARSGAADEERGTRQRRAVAAAEERVAVATEALTRARRVLAGAERALAEAVAGLDAARAAA